MQLSALMVFAAVLPALADTRFQIRRMTRGDVPIGKGQCDIRLQVDNEVEVQVRGNVVTIRNLAGQPARDDGSECSAPLPNRDIEGFRYEVRESRNDIRLVAEPSRRNDFTAIVHIRDSAGSFGRYHFRLSWAVANERPGFASNNALSFRGNGRGGARYNDAEEQRLRDVTIDVDRGGKLAATFRAERGRPISFSGTVMAREQGKWKAEVVSEDRRLRGPMWFSVDDRGNVSSVSIEATDGRDKVRVTWDRR